MSNVRMNITLPEELVQELRKIAKANMSKFIADATEEKIRYEKRQRAIEELKKLPPLFPQIKDSAKYIHDMRRLDNKRLERLGIK